MRLNKSLVLVALIVVLAVVMPPLGLATAAGTEGAMPVAHTVSPRPGEVVAAGQTPLMARVRTGEPVASVRLSVDGTTVEGVQVGQTDARGDVPVTASVVLAVGEHFLRLQVEDASGDTAERTWSVQATSHTSARVAGRDRFETAVATSAMTFPAADSAAAAVLARGDDFADALTGAPLATAVRGPLLLARGDGLPEQVAEELARVLPAAATVHLLGGEAALDEGVVRDVEALGLTVARHAGPDRFATAAAVARLLPSSRAVLVASGASFPDALTASAPSARDGFPVLLTAPQHLPDSTAAVLVERDASFATIVGGTGVVSEIVEQRVGELVERVERVGGTDRFATAAAVLETFYEEPSAVSLASGTAFPDALAGTVHAAAAGQPLLLTAPRTLPPATAAPLRTHRPEHVTVYGGIQAVGEAVMSAALRAAHDGPAAPRIVSASPRPLGAVTYLDTIVVTFDRPVDPLASTMYLDVAGLEVPGSIQESEVASTLTLRVADDTNRQPSGASYPARVVVAAGSIGGAVGHDELTFTYTVPDPVFATAGVVALHLPSWHVEMVGLHESSHDGAQQLSIRDTATTTMPMPTRYRGTGSRTAADVVSSPDRPVLAPVTGRVLRAGSYVLYCDYTDNFVVIEPDARPGWEVKLLHFRGLQVSPGDRVTAGTTIVGDGPRTLPFASQVDEFSDDRNWPHVHLEVVDPSIPDRPGRGC